METRQNSPPERGRGPRSGGGADRRVSHRTVGASHSNTRQARALRRTMTLPEVLLWQQLRHHPGGFRFRRQYPCHGFVIDFASLERRVAIEIDGEAHARGDRPERDARRDAVLAEFGFETLRIAARDVLANLEGVVAHILSTCSARPLHHSRLRGNGPPSRSGEELILPGTGRGTSEAGGGVDGMSNCRDLNA